MEENKPRLILFNARNRLVRLDVSKIVYLEGDGNYTNVVTVNKIKICLCINLTNIEKVFAEQLGDAAHAFIRIGKRYIINIKYVYVVNVTKQLILMTDYDKFTFQVPISKDALKKVKDLIVEFKQ